MNNENLKDSVRDVIYANGANLITGDVLQDTLVTIINHFGSGSVYAGFAVPTTNPINTDVNMFYLAKVPGTYTNFAGYVLNAGKVVVFSNKTGSWVADDLLTNYVSEIFDPTTTTIPQGGKQISDYVKKPQSIGAIQVSGGGPDVSPTLNFVLANSYIDAAGNVQSNPGTSVTDLIPVPDGYTKLLADESGTFTIATYNDVGGFLATLGGSVSPVEFNKLFNLDPLVKSIKYIHRDVTISTAKLTFKSDAGSPKYILPWLKTVDDSNLEFKQNVRDIAGSFDFTLNPINGNVIVSGDSTVAAYLGGTAIVDIISATGTKTNIAVPGHTILQQQTAYQSLASGTKTAANFVFVQIGLNDVTYSGNANAAITRMQTFINVIKAGSPNAKIIVCAMNPALAAWKGANPDNYMVAYSNWRQMNYFFENGISGANKFINLHVEIISDGNGNLDPIYDVGDGIHENTAARKIIAYGWICNYEK